MGMAAMEGKLPIIEALVALGLKVNESDDHSLPGEPFYQPEGPIVHAAAAGHLDIVRWLLEHGAQINYVVNGRPRCQPLIYAATNGHLDIVKLLVEYGADLHSDRGGVYASTQAEDFRHFEVRDYLRSLGVKTMREKYPPDYESAHRCFIDDMTFQRGPMRGFRVEIPGEPLVVLRESVGNEVVPTHTIFTVGLSDHRLPFRGEPDSCAELRFMLPSDWPLDENALRDARWNWPIEHLKRIVAELRSATQWPEEPTFFMNGDPPTPLGPGTLFSGWLCVVDNGASIQVPDYRWINIWSLYPIYNEEHELIKSQGLKAFIKKSREQKMPLHIVPDRPNVAIDAR